MQVIKLQDALHQYTNTFIMKSIFSSLLFSVIIVGTGLSPVMAQDTPAAAVSGTGDYDADELSQWWKRELKRRKQAYGILAKIKTDKAQTKACKAIKKIFTTSDGELKDPVPEKTSEALTRNKYREIQVDDETVIRTALPEKQVRTIINFSNVNPCEAMEKKNLSLSPELETVIKEYLSDYPGVL